MKAPRLFFYVQHLLGIGHQVRARALAAACVQAGFTVDMADGGFDDGTHPDIKGVVRHPLPPARSSDAGFSGLVNSDGEAIDEAWKAERCDRLLRLFEECRPAVVLIEGFPFARRAFRFELVPLLEAAKVAGVPVVVSVRDIIQPKRADRVPEVLDWLNRFVDLILVHGDPALIPFSISFPAVRRIAPRLVHTGYVSAAYDRAVVPERRGIVVSGGGGAVAAALFDASVEAARDLGGRFGPWRLLVGPNHPPEHADDLRRHADNKTLIVEPARDDFRDLLQSSLVSISQCGYNTSTDLIVTRTPAVLVPFEQAGQQEQRLRANRLAAAGRAVVVGEDDLTAGALAEAVEEGADMRLNLVRPIAMDGAERSARELQHLIEGAVNER